MNGINKHADRSDFDLNLLELDPIAYMQLAVFGMVICRGCNPIDQFTYKDDSNGDPIIIYVSECVYLCMYVPDIVYFSIIIE